MAAFDLLRRACAAAAPQGVSASLIAAPDRMVNWELFLRLVERHRVPGLVHAGLGHLPDVVPEPVRQAIAGQAQALARRNLALVAATIRLQQLFDAAGIEVIFFKGALVGQRAYGSLAVKHGKDIDFLVPPEDLAATFALLAGEGYQPVFPAAPLTAAKIDALRDFQIEAVMADPARGVQLEPHWRLTENRRLLPLGPLRAGAAKRANLGGVPIRGFHPDDEFAYLCVHGVRSGWFRLKWLADLHALLAGQAEAERLRLYRHAEGRGAGPAALLAYGLCRDLFALPVPAALVGAVEAPLQRAMRGLCHASLGASHPQTSLRQVLLLPMLHAVACGPAHIGSEVLRWGVNGQDVMELPLPRYLFFLYPLLRLPLWAGRQIAGRGMFSGPGRAP
ncbi:nucleotidyltransferase domain-containing protein [Ancylobacter sp.]|uniref:nucleotidyltransferase domain-containing protein n=1 Tax=Ancylobacter sp. TaxID=1872567 RepID=UPI003BABAE62